MLFYISRFIFIGCQQLLPCKMLQIFKINTVFILCVQILQELYFSCVADSFGITLSHLRGSAVLLDERQQRSLLLYSCKAVSLHTYGVCRHSERSCQAANSEEKNHYMLTDPSGKQDQHRLSWWDRLSTSNGIYFTQVGQKKTSRCHADHVCEMTRCLQYL